MKKVLITGANGFVGKNLINKFKKKKYKLYSTYFKSKPSLKLKKLANFIKINLLNIHEYSNLPSECDYIIHLAGDPRTFLKKKNSKIQIYNNIKITKNLGHYAKKVNCKHFIFLSSVYVYSGCKNVTFRENLKLSPKESLGKSKHASEKLLKQFSRFSNFKVTILRPFTLYGPFSRKNQFLSIVKNKIRSKSKIILLENSYPIRNFLHVYDLIKAIIKLLQKKQNYKFNIYNVAYNKSFSIRSVVIKLLKISKKKKKIFFLSEKKLDNLNGNTNHIACTKKIYKDIKWDSSIHINKGLKLFYDQ